MGLTLCFPVLRVLMMLIYPVRLLGKQPKFIDGWVDRYFFALLLYLKYSALSHFASRHHSQRSLLLQKRMEKIHTG